MSSLNLTCFPFVMNDLNLKRRSQINRKKRLRLQAPVKLPPASEKAVNYLVTGRWWWLGWL
jgi:hypothetical protein